MDVNINFIKPLLSRDAFRSFANIRNCYLSRKTIFINLQNVLLVV